MRQVEIPAVVVTTGATAGVGRALARRYAADGARIGLLARGEDGLAATQLEVEALGAEALAIPTDVADSGQVEEAAARIEARFGPITLWINNAMASVFSPVSGMCVEDYRRVTDVTYLGTVHGTMAALKRMRPRDHGTIVQVGSALAYRGIPLQSAYCAAKHAVQGFCDSLRCELLHERSGIRLTMVQLPAVNTPQFSWVKSRLPREPKPMGRIFSPAFIADAIHWAAAHPKRERLIAWPAVKAVIGNALVPSYADRVLARTGFDGQQTDERVATARQDNLWLPVPGDHGADGAFTGEAHGSSVEWWIEKHRAHLAVAVGVVAAGSVAGAAWWRSRRQSRKAATRESKPSRDPHQAPA